MAKQNNPITPVPYSFGSKSGIVSDVDPRDIKQGDFLVTGVYKGNQNMRNMGDGLNVTPGYEPVRGNSFSYLISEATLQTKKFRIYIDVQGVSGSNGFTIELKTPTNNELVTHADTITVTDIATALGDIDTILQAELATYSPTTSTTQTGSNTGYIDIEFGVALYFDYELTISVDTGDLLGIDVEVTQEAVDQSMIGEWKLIGSCDRTGYDFQAYTTRDVLPSEVDILNVTNPSGTIVRIETLTSHGLIDNESVLIQGIQGTVEANGEWTISNVTPTTFELDLCVYISAYVSGGVVKTRIKGLGEIGVVVRNPDKTDTYTRLLRSGKFNFTTLKQIDVRVKRKQDSKFAAYFTDDYNNPRVFYYKGDFITDGALSINGGQYDYGTINDELKLSQSATDFSLKWSSQIQSGGAVRSGNWRYAARLLTSDFTPTPFSQLTDTVPVYDFNYESSPLVIGDNSAVPTSKINILELTDNTGGIYNYVEIAAVNYFGNNGIQAYIIGRYSLSGDIVQYFQHTGNENALVDLDLGELNRFVPAFVNARNVELLDNRLILSDLTPASVIDFSDWVRTFRYSLDREVLDPIGVWPTGALQTGEYQLPENVYSNKTHMMMETYRYGFRFKLKGSGFLTQVFYPGYDIKIDLPTTLPSERVGGTFTSFDLTDNNAPPTEVYSIVINWQNINMSFLIDDIPAYELIEEIIPCRAEVVPTVLGHGVVIAGVSGVQGTFPDALAFYGQTSGTAAIGPYPYIVGATSSPANPVYPLNPTYAQGTQGSGAFGFDSERSFGFFYCPDHSFNLLSVEYQSSDQIISFGAPERHNEAQVLPAFTLFTSFYSEFNGYSGITSNPAPYTINDSRDFPFNGGIGPTQYGVPADITVGGSGVNLQICIDDLIPLDDPYPFITDKCIVTSLASPLANTGSNTDYGFYRAVYYRPLSDQYGDPESTVYTEFLEPYRVADERAIIPSGEVIAQGDCFTQKTYLKFRYPGWFDRASTTQENDGLGGGMAYYSQNRNNLQLRCKPDEQYPAAAVIQQLPITAWLVFGYADPTGIAAGNNLFYIGFRDSQLFYNQGYTPRNQVLSERVFDSRLDYQVDWSNAIAWSNPESEGSNTDNLRIFPPLNLKFLDYTDGPITDARAINGELITIQPRSVQRQYFNTTAIITTQDGGEAQLGSGAVLSRRGSVMNKYGSSNKWSVLTGLSDMGHDVLYAIDTTNKVAWRMGYNGTNALEEVNGMKSFFANYLDWVRTVDTPAHGEGICGVTNQRFKEVIWTMRGRKPVQEWTDRETEVTLLDFNTILGDELIEDPLFNAGMYSWEQLGVPPPNTWLSWPGSGAPSVYKPAAIGVGDYLKQVNNIPLVSGTTYRVKIVIVSAAGTSPNNIQIRFQIPGTLIYTLPGTGTYYFTYTAQVGDDNITIFGPASTFVRVGEVSIKEILSTSNWTGAPTWLIGNNEATADGSDGDDLTQNTPDYIVPNDTCTLDFEIANRTTGQVRVEIGNALSAPIGTNGVQQVILNPTLTGVVSFQPSGGFDGTIKGTMRLTCERIQVYNQGDVVQVPGFTTFELFPDLYEVVAETTGGSLPNPSNPDYQLIPHTDPRYYNEYTIVYAENKDAWSMFLTPKPKIYSKFLDTYFTPRPVSDTGRMYLADSGTWTSWYEGQQADAFIDPVINQPTGRKRFLAARIESDIAPERMEVITENGTNITPSSDFVQREGAEFDGFVKSEVSTDSISWGDYGIFRLVVRQGTYNKINSFIAKVRQRARAYFS